MTDPQPWALLAPLPDPFLADDGTRIIAPADWPRRRQELLATIQDIGYGRLPPRPEALAIDLLHGHAVKHFGGAAHRQYRVGFGPGRGHHFILDLIIPPIDGPLPVVLHGDGCWCYAGDTVIAEVLARGYILARFNRCELAPDIGDPTRDTGIYPLYPDDDFGALAAWAWGYHRCVDVLLTLPEVDGERIAVTGHSRGGKTVLLAAATDERIVLAAPNGSGAGGAGCYRFRGPDCERLADLIRQFRFWFGPRLPDYVGRETDLPYDLHELKALVAPRPLLCTEALGDLWANPMGTRQSHAATRCVYRFLGAGDALGLHYREGEHRHDLADWLCFLDFADLHLQGRTCPRDFLMDPWPDLPPAFSWREPGAG